MKEMLKLCSEVGRKKSNLSDENICRQKCNVHDVLSIFACSLELFDNWGLNMK